MLRPFVRICILLLSAWVPGRMSGPANASAATTAASRTAHTVTAANISVHSAGTRSPRVLSGALDAKHVSTPVAKPVPSRPSTASNLSDPTAVVSVLFRSSAPPTPARAAAFVQRTLFEMRGLTRTH